MFGFGARCFGFLWSSYETFSYDLGSVPGLVLQHELFWVLWLGIPEPKKCKSQWDFQGPPIMGPPYPYSSHTILIRIPKDLGVVWETYHKGVPLLGVPGLIGRWSHNLQGFLPLRWCGISAINSMSIVFFVLTNHFTAKQPNFPHVQPSCGSFVKDFISG